MGRLMVTRIGEVGKRLVAASAVCVLPLLSSCDVKENKTEMIDNIFLKTEYGTPHETFPFDKVKLDDYLPAVKEAIRLHDEEIIAVGDHAAEMVRQTAVRIRNELSFFEQDDLRMFVQPSQPRGCAGARGNSADDNGFHCGILRACPLKIPFSAGTGQP